MPQYVMTYFGGNPPATPEEGKAHMQAYQAWLGELGASAISPMNPLRGAQTISPEGAVKEGSTSRMSGYTIIELDTMELAVAAAKRCPFLGIGGTLEVAELVDMST